MINPEYVRTLPAHQEFVKSDVAVPSLTRYEAFRGKHDKVKKKLVVEGGVLKGGNIDVSWLPAAAETYNISADPDDYILVDVPIVTCDLSNRNGQAFSREECAYYDPLHGKQTYKTFVGKSTFMDHDNQEPLKSKGVIFDAAMEYVREYDVWKIRILAGYDRTKDPQLVQQISSCKRPGFSMGALGNYFVCSWCGATDTNVNPCLHQDVQRGNGRGSLWSASSDRRVHANDAQSAYIVDGMATASAIEAASDIRLIYQLVCGVNFFECSSVADPADTTATIDGVSTPIWIP